MRGSAGIFVSAAAAAALLAPASAPADTFKPTRLDDPPVGKCKKRDCSLREAMKAADALEGRDKVVLGKGRYELQIPGTGASDGGLDLIDAVVLRGQGSRKTKIDANGLDQVLTGWLNLESGSFAIRDLTLTGGVAGPITANRGGGIAASSEDRYTLEGLVIKGNEADFGGGIYSASPELTVKDTTIKGNTADEGGGLDLVGRANEAPQTVIRSSTISGNTAIKGAGMLADGHQPSTIVEEPVVRMLNSTVALNNATADGGGIMADNEATVTLGNATVAYNNANSDSTGGGVAGGVYQHSGAIFGLADSIVAKNGHGVGGAAPQCEGAFAATAGGVVESQSTGTCTVPGSNVVPDARIGLLGDNGGPTQTIRLLSGSPAIGFDHEGCPKRDQRGVKRPPQGCDSGAFERKKP